MRHISDVTGYHAHIYFDLHQREQARSLCEQASDVFGVQMGRMHERPLGPHPKPSCQLGATPQQFARLLPWLVLNRAGLTVFAHAETGDHLKDHRDHVIWLGDSLPVDLSIFG